MRPEKIRLLTVHVTLLSDPACRDTAEASAEDDAEPVEEEVDDYKAAGTRCLQQQAARAVVLRPPAAELYGVTADRLRGLAYRELTEKESTALGRCQGRVTVRGRRHRLAAQQSFAYVTCGCLQVFRLADVLQLQAAMKAHSADQQEKKYQAAAAE